MINRMDLKRKYNEHKDEYLSAFLKVCEDTAFSGGKYAQQFEQEFAAYCGVKAMSGVNSGTSALFCSMMALGVGSGDEVIVPANTFIATAWGPTHAGATPVFVDCTENTWLMDAEKLENAITEKTKAIIGVHLYGMPFDVDKVKAIANRHKIPLIEDAAQAHGAVYKGKKVGSLGEMACFSFYPGKNLCCFGEGGGVTSDNIEYIEKINTIKNHGCKQRYYHDMVGYNMRLEGIQGAVLSVSLKDLDRCNKRRQQIADRYKNEITNSLLKKQVSTEGAESVYHLYVVLVDEREKFIDYMKEKSINCEMHYPVPCHLQQVYRPLGYKMGDLPNAEYQAAHCVTLPMYPELTDEEVSLVVDACNKYK